MTWMAVLVRLRHVGRTSEAGPGPAILNVESHAQTVVAAVESNKLRLEHDVTKDAHATGRGRLQTTEAR